MLARWFVFGLIGLSCCACSEDENSGGNGGSGGDAGAAGGSGTGGDGGAAGNAGAAGSGGTAGSGGSAGGAAGSGGQAGGAGGTTSGGAGGTGAASGVTCETYQSEEICSAACTDFPVTLDLGSSIAVGRSGALLCYAETPATCFATNNTYSDGPAACDQKQPVFAWLDSNNGSRGFSTASGWHIKSASVGTVEATTAQYVTNVPDATAITAVVNDGPLDAPGANDYEVVFAFAGAAVTFTSVTPL